MSVDASLSDSSRPPPRSVEVITTSQEAIGQNLFDATVVVFDVLRATSTMVTALHSGAIEVRCFETIEQARLARDVFDGPAVLAGERGGLRPEGFDLGNTPADFTPERVSGRTIFFTTTNGTRALLGAGGAARLLVGALVNATATARGVLARTPAGGRVVLLAAGTDGRESAEDLIGCGAVLDALARFAPVRLVGPNAMRALELHRSFAGGDRRWWEASPGASNLRAVGLGADVDWCGTYDLFETIAIGSGPTVRKSPRSV